MPRTRKPNPGANRTDLLTQPVKVPTGLPYGEASALRDAQQAAPLPAGPDPRQVLSSAESAPPPPPITAPTAMPGEPVTTGLSSGPGGGPEVLGATPGLSPLDMLRGFYRAYPDPEIARLISYAEAEGP